MKITRRILSFVLAAVMAIGTLAVTASAESIPEIATPLASGQKVALKSPQSFYKYYKVELSQKGTLTLDITSKANWVNVCLQNAKGKYIKCSEWDCPTGSISARDDRDEVNCLWNSFTESFEGTLKYQLEKGTYYIGICGYPDEKTTFKATYPSKSKSTGKITYLTLEMEAGDTIRLGTVSEPADADVTWKSSKSSVATVSSTGKVTAKKKGTTIITAKSGTSSKKIKIIVV